MKENQNINIFNKQIQKISIPYIDVMFFLIANVYFNVLNIPTFLLKVKMIKINIELHIPHICDDFILIRLQFTIEYKNWI